MVTTVTTSSISRPSARSARRSAAALLVAGVVIAAAAASVIALVARAVGADGFPALQPLVYLPFVILGFAAATAGWAIVRARSSRPARLLRFLVPAATVLSLSAPVALAVLRFIPGTTLTGAVALMLMHLVVVAVAVPVLARALPLPPRD